MEKIYSYIKALPINTKVLIFFFCFYVFFMSGHIGGDALWTYLTSESTVCHGNLIINDHPDRVWGIPELQSSYNNIALREGDVISIYGIGNVIVQLPFFFLGWFVVKICPFLPADYVQMFFASMTNCVISALLCYFLFNFLKHIGINNKVSIITTFGFGLSLLIFTNGVLPIRSRIVFPTFFSLTI